MINQNLSQQRLVRDEVVVAPVLNPESQLQRAIQLASTKKMKYTYLSNGELLDVYERAVKTEQLESGCHNTGEASIELASIRAAVWSRMMQ